MADVRKIVPGNVSGDFFVDSTCINCDNCRQLAPTVFGEFGDYAGVKKQPQNDHEYRMAVRALIACPTGSIGTQQKNNAKEVMQDFPIPISDDVYYCGFNSPKSAGGKSYFVTDSHGNWLVDCPKYHPHLVKAFEKLGGLKYIFLTHRDDVADAEHYATKFGAQRIIHFYDVEAQPDAEIVLEGDETLEVAPGFLVIPMPGHTEGHCMMLYKDQFLFSGDSLTSDRTRAGLQAWDPLWTWYSYTEQTKSLTRLRQYNFELVLPGHGKQFRADLPTMRKEVDAAIRECLDNSDPDPISKIKLEHLEMYVEEMRREKQPLYAEKIEQQANALKRKLQNMVGSKPE